MSKTLTHLIPLAIVIFWKPIPSYAAEMWDDANIQVFGNGCTPNDILVMTSGFEVSVILPSMSINLLGENGFPQAEKKRCHLIFPTVIARGFSVGVLNQSIRITATKSELGSHLAISAWARFFQNVLPELVFVAGNGQSIFDEEIRQADFDLELRNTQWRFEWCRQDQRGELEVFIESLGKVSASMGTVGTGPDLKYTAEGRGVLVCP